MGPPRSWVLVPRSLGPLTVASLSLCREGTTLLVGNLTLYMMPHTSPSIPCEYLWIHQWTSLPAYTYGKRTQHRFCWQGNSKNWGILTLNSITALGPLLTWHWVSTKATRVISLVTPTNTHFHHSHTHTYTCLKSWCID